ncbi:MAG: PilZ domain-containing protein [Bdellovibrionales bacterium]|nr:PilZ domain-containing protein [Bdellovibrionales bacterium]
MKKPYDKPRKFERFKAKVDVISKIESEPKTFQTRDISEGGLCLLTETPPFVGEILTLVIYLDSDSKIDTKAEVVWRHQGVGCGLRFFKLTARERESLHKYLQKVSTTKED